MGMIYHFDTTHFPEVQPYKTYSYPEFQKNVFSLFKTPDLSHVKIKELMSAQQKPDQSVLEYKGRVLDIVAKAFPKVTDANPQDLAISMFFQGLAHQDLGRITAI